MKTFRKILLAFTLVSVCVLANNTAAAQVTGGCQKMGPDKHCCNPKKKYYRVGQWVDVEMKDNTTIRARVMGKAGKNQYWLQQVGGDRKGVAHARHLTPVATELISPSPIKADLRRMVALSAPKKR